MAWRVLLEPKGRFRIPEGAVVWKVSLWLWNAPNFITLVYRWLEICSRLRRLELTIYFNIYLHCLELGVWRNSVTSQDRIGVSSSYLTDVKSILDNDWLRLLSNLLFLFLIFWTQFSLQYLYVALQSRRWAINIRDGLISFIDRGNLSETVADPAQRCTDLANWVG